MTAYDRLFIGIDYGERRIGLAKSDPTGLIATPLMTLEVRSIDEAVTKIMQVIEEYEPNGVVVGYPLQVSREKSEKCRDIDAFIKKLAEQYDGPIYTEDEQYSSVEATDMIHAHGKHFKSEKKRVDRLAAAVILQRYLDGLPRQ